MSTATADRRLAAARAALAEERFETARRLAQACDDDGAALVLHDALARLGDLRAAMAALDRAGDGFESAIRRLDDLHRASSYHGFYRGSPEAARGLSYAEFLAGRHAERASAARRALDAIADAGQAARVRDVLRRAVADHERRAPSDQPALAELDARWPAPPERASAIPPIPVLLRGRVIFPDGAVPAGLVTLGVEAPSAATHPLDVDPHVIGIPSPAAGTLTALQAPLAGDGSFTIAGTTHPGTGFLALTLSDPGSVGVPTRYLARGLRIDGSPLPPLELPCAAWSPAEPAEPPSAPPRVIEHLGRTWRLRAHEFVRNPFWHDFPRQDLRLAWPAPPAGGAALAWVDGAVVPHQLDRAGQVLLFADAPRRSVRTIAWYHADGPALAAGGSLLRIGADPTSAVLDTGRSAFRIPWGSATDAVAPVLAVMGPDRVWRGQGRWELPAGTLPQRTTTIIADGPLECVVEVAYRFATGERCSFTLTVHAGEEYLLVEERGEALEGAAFVLGLEDFRGGRGYLHWCAEGEAPHWHDLVDADRELARLQESVPWWIPPAGFAWAASFDGLERRDQVGVFSRRRGDWIDHAFAAIAKGPPEGGHELDWPYPEMVGSTISMITVSSTADGRLGARFPRFAGERHWGILASDVGRGDGPLKELQQVRHKTSFPRLDEMRRWHLDHADPTPRPCVVAERARLPEIRASLARPGCDGLWRRLQEDSRYGEAEALRFALTGDPILGWRLARRLAAMVPAQSRCLLLSRENGDVWSPVGGRVWAPQALVYDAVVASGALSADEEREVRAGFILAGHMFRSPDLMNWRYGGRNANFEADRVEVVGSVGLCFAGNPDAASMVEHAIERMHAALGSYCTPGSGKWYENPACYYLHAMKCRMAIACRLAERGRLDLAAVPRMREYLGWLLLMLTPPLPASYDTMRDGCSHGDYAALKRVRRIAPVGDHAHLGPWVPDIAAVAAKWLQDGEPGLAGALRWAWHAGGCDGGYHGGAAQLLAQSHPAELAVAAARDPGLASRRLEGFGAVFRGKVGAADEFMLLAKLGPGGYRYHRSEGSFILVADGRPLVYDGGEAGEAWRHSAITYHDARMPPAPGRIERFAALPGADYAQGAHPVVLAPGDPVFLSDVCDHRLVAEAHRRARIDRPAAARAWLWVKDDYVVLWDRLDVEAGLVNRWNLQVMADGESGDLAGGLRFRGRFGTDLQVAMPAGGDRPWRVEEVRMHEYHLPRERCVAQRHLEIDACGPGDWLAVLRPLPPGRAPVAASPLHALGRCVGARIRGDGIDDHVVIGRSVCAIADAAWSFAGIAGACLRRPDALRLILLGPGRIAVGDAVLESDGPAAELTLGQDGPRLVRDGAGTVLATVGGRRLDG